MGDDADTRGDRAGLVRGGGRTVVALYQPLPRHVGPERLPARVSAMPRLRPGVDVPACAGDHCGKAIASERGLMIRRRAIGLLVGLVASTVVGVRDSANAQSETAPLIVVETSKGSFAFVTFPNEAPRTVAHIVELV